MTLAGSWNDVCCIRYVDFSLVVVRFGKFEKKSDKILALQQRSYCNKMPIHCN